MTSQSSSSSASASSSEYASDDDDDERTTHRRRTRAPMEPDYKSVVSTLSVPDEHRAFVFVRIAVPLNCHERTTPAHRCSFGFFFDTRLTVRNLMAQTRTYCGLLHQLSAHRARLARVCDRDDEEETCTCHRGTACKIVSSGKQWLFVNHSDNTPLLPHEARHDETEWFESIGACAASITPSSAPTTIDLSVVADMVPVYRRLERPGADAFYDATVDSAMEQGALETHTSNSGHALSRRVADEIVHAYRTSTHISFLCQSTIEALIETLRLCVGGHLPLATSECDVGECVCDDTNDVDVCAVCNLATRCELTALLSVYVDDDNSQIVCTQRSYCTCIADALIRRSTRHVLEFDAVPRTDDLTYIAMGDSIYAGQSPLARLANESSARIGWRPPHYGTQYAIGTQQLKSLRKRAATAYGGYVLAAAYDDVIAEARRMCAMESAPTLVHIVVACAIRGSKASATGRGLLPPLNECRDALKWLPRMGRVLLTPFCSNEAAYDKLLEVVRSMTPSNTGEALDDDRDFERTMYRELQHEPNKRMAMARVLAFVDDPTDFEHFARVAGALIITFGVVKLAQRCCVAISERSCAQFLASLSADKERRQQRQARAKVRAKALAARAREKAGRIRLQRIRAEAARRRAIQTAKLQRKRQRRAKPPVKKVRTVVAVKPREKTSKKPPVVASAPSPPPLDVTRPFTWNRTFDAARLFYDDAVHDVRCCTQ